FSRRYEMSISCGTDSIYEVSLDHRGNVVPSQEETDKSDDLQADIRTMWSIDKNGRSTQEAIHAASRVFNTVHLTGMNREDISMLIGDDSFRAKGRYNTAFWPAEGKGLVYRFDCGYYGWQFNLRFDNRGECDGVKRIWIH